MNEPTPNQPPSGGSKLSTIFLVVLGLHVVLIVAFSAYHLLKGDTRVEPTEATTAESVQPEVPSGEGAPAEALHPDSPVVETEHRDAPAAPADHAASLPMPSSTDPIWQGQPDAGGAPLQPAPAPAANLPAPAPVASLPAPAPSAAGESAYTVVKGDSLAKIARLHGVTVADLKRANSLTSDMIRIGQTLAVPAARAAAPAPAVATVRPAVPVAVPVAAASAESGAGTYVVSRGDTLWSIARKFNIKPDQLASLNGIDDPSKLKIGTVLKVPGTVKQDMATPPAPRPAPVPVPARATDMAMVPAAN